MILELGPRHPLLAGRTGAGIDVAILDSGVHPGHPHVGGLASACALDDRGNPDPDPLDRLGHGTAVTAAIHEKAPGARLHVVKVFHTSLSTTILALVRALDHATGSGMRLVNLSLGTVKEEHGPLLEQALERARERGALVVSARSRDGNVWFPGTLSGAVGVDLDPSCPRDSLRIAGGGGWSPVGSAREGDGATPGGPGPLRVQASGHPRPIPGVPPERNLNGVSFAVANVTGVLACLLEGRDHIRDVELLEHLLRSSGKPPAPTTP